MIVFYYPQTFVSLQTLYYSFLFPAGDFFEILDV